MPHLPEREEFGLSSAYLVQLTRHFSLQAGTRTAYYDYASTDRNDFNLSLSAGADLRLHLLVQCGSDHFRRD